jgi:hypothetical protein
MSATTTEAPTKATRKSNGKTEAATVKAPVTAPKAPVKSAVKAPAPKVVAVKPVEVAPVKRGRGRPVKPVEVNDGPITDYHGKTVALVLEGERSILFGVLEVEQGVRDPLVTVRTGERGRPPVFLASQIESLREIKAFAVAVSL